jgi:hypothetical protein
MLVPARPVAPRLSSRRSRPGSQAPNGTATAPAKGKGSVLNGLMWRSTTYCAAVGMAGPANSSNGNGESGFWNGKTWKLIAAI